MRKFSRLPDESLLVQQAAEGDRLAYGKLYSHYYLIIYNSLVHISKSHEDAEEIIQEAFLKVWKTKEGLIAVKSFEDYLYTIAKNLLFNYLKRKKTGLKVMDVIADPALAETEDSPDKQYLYKQYYHTYLAAVSQLTEQKRKIFLLRSEEGLTLKSIAAEMGISRPAVKKHLYGAISFIKEYLQRHGEGFIILLLLYFFKEL